MSEPLTLDTPAPAERIRQAIARSGLTVTALAARVRVPKLGISRVYLSKLAHGHLHAHPALVAAIEEAADRARVAAELSAAQQEASR
jgi:transcriptional regulator with XRE-family HTH domain